MKKLVVILLLTYFFSSVNSQFKNIGVLTGVGHTLVDIEKAIDWDELEDWDHVGVIIKATTEYELKDELFLYGEIGSTRLYYWEYRWSDGFYSGYRFRSEWTTNMEIHLKKYFDDAWFIQGGPGVHIFNDGSGTVPGITAAAGYTAYLTDEISIPVAARVESVFGNATPTALLITIGFNYDISDLF